MTARLRNIRACTYKHPEEDRGLVRSLHENPRHRRQQGSPAELHGDRWPGPRQSGRWRRARHAQTATRTTRLTTARKCASRSRMKVPCLSFRAAATPPRKPIAPSAFTGDATKSRTTSAASKIDGASPRVTTNSLETSLLPPPSSGRTTGSNCESRP